MDARGVCADLPGGACACVWWWGEGRAGAAARVERGGAHGAAPAIASTCVGAVHARHMVKAYTWPGSNWRPSACEADVIATRPQVLLTPCHRRGLSWPVHERRRGGAGGGGGGRGPTRRRRGHGSWVTRRARLASAMMGGVGRGNAVRLFLTLAAPFETPDALRGARVRAASLLPLLARKTAKCRLPRAGSSLHFAVFLARRGRRWHLDLRGTMATRELGFGGAGCAVGWVGLGARVPSAWP